MLEHQSSRKFKYNKHYPIILLLTNGRWMILCFRRSLVWLYVLNDGFEGAFSSWWCHGPYLHIYLLMSDGRCWEYGHSLVWLYVLNDGFKGAFSSWWCHGPYRLYTTVIITTSLQAIVILWNWHMKQYLCKHYTDFDDIYNNIQYTNHHIQKR